MGRSVVSNVVGPIRLKLDSVIGVEPSERKLLSSSRARNVALRMIPGLVSVQLVAA